MYTLQLDSTCSQEDSPPESVSPPMDNGLNVIIWKAGVDYKTAATYLGGFNNNTYVNIYILEYSDTSKVFRFIMLFGCTVQCTYMFVLFVY